MEEYKDLEDQEGQEGEEDFVALSPKGYQRIFEWARFQVQVCEMLHSELNECDDDAHEVAFLVTLAFLPLMKAMHISTEEEISNKCETCGLEKIEFVIHHLGNEQCVSCQQDLM